MKSLAMLLGLLAPLVLGAGTNRVQELPVEVFFRAPQFSSMKISDDGCVVAGIAHDGGDDFLFGINLVTGERKSIATGKVHGFSWLTNERLLVRCGGIGEGGLLAIDRDGSHLAMLQKPFGFQLRDRARRLQIANVLCVPSDQSNTFLLEKAEFEMFGRLEPPHPEVWRVNYYTGTSALEQKNPGSVIHWLADGRGVVRAGYAVEKDSEKILYRRNKTDPWTVIYEARGGGERIKPMGFSSDGEELYVVARDGKDTAGFFTFDRASGRPARCLWQVPEFDYWAFIREPNSGPLVGVIYQSDRPRVDWLRSRLRSVQEAVDAGLPETSNIFLNSSGDESRCVITSFSDRAPGAYYVMDTNRNELNLLCSRAPWINPKLMAEVRPISYKARDGLNIRGYLTLPVGSHGMKLPMVVMPHAGLTGRDVWGFKPEVQFFANRGYSVLQVNFRGLPGYGLKFSQAGYHEWGRKTQDDITDGVEWAIKEGIADVHRIGIYGASYGGYSALMGLISTPDLFKCGICYAGATDVSSELRRSLLRIPRMYDFIEQELLDYYRVEEKNLDAVSPMQHVDKIRAPLFLAYGGRDPVVDVEQARVLAKALDKGKKKYEMVIEETEGHGFSNETNRIKLFKRIDKFLKANL